jgi:hypothetical protein
MTVYRKFLQVVIAIIGNCYTGRAWAREVVLLYSSMCRCMYVRTTKATGVSNVYDFVICVWWGSKMKSSSESLSCPSSEYNPLLVFPPWASDRENSRLVSCEFSKLSIILPTSLLRNPKNVKCVLRVPSKPKCTSSPTYLWIVPVTRS